MKNFIVIMLIALAAMSFAPAVQAQTALLPFTTTSAAVATGTALQTTIYLSSLTNVVAGGLTAPTGAGTVLVIDQEAMLVNSTVGTIGVQVTRGFQGTFQTTHASGAVVYLPTQKQYSTRDRAGSCTAASEGMLPIVSLNQISRYVMLYDCVGGQWISQQLPGSTSPTIQACTVPVGSVAYASFGTSTQAVAATTFYSTVQVPRTAKFTGIKVLQNGTVGTDKLNVELRSASGRLLATSALTGTSTVGANTFLVVPFTTPYVVTGQSEYYVGVSGNGSADGIRTQAASTFVDTLAGTATGGTFGTILTQVTMPTTFTANTGPIACLY